MKKITCVVLSLVIVFTVLPVSASASEAINIFIDGEKADLNAMAEMIDGTLYVSLRITATALGADKIQWDRDTMTASVYVGDTVINASASTRYIEAGGRYFYAPYGCLYRDGYTKVPAEALCRSFGASITFDSGNVYIMSTDGPIMPAGQVYNEDDLYWLSRIIHAEAQGEVFEGKIAVGNVVMNRLGSPEFPNSIYDIIFDNTFGEQFTPAWNGAIYCTPSEESLIAAKIALEGYDITGGCLYFAAAHVAAVCWAGQNRPYVTQIENHVFFA